MPDPPASSSPRGDRLPAAGLALLLGLVLAAAVAGPDLPRLWTSLPGWLNDDGLHALYLHHQVHDALLAGRFDLSDPNQLWPVGAPLLRMHGGNVLEMLVSGLCRMVLPWPAWLSAAALLWIPLNLLAFVPLGRALWGRTDVALAAGAAWAVSPPLLAQMGALRLTQVALMGLPLAVLGLWRVTTAGGRRAALLCGAGFALLGYGYWFYAGMLAVCAPLFVVSAWRGGRPLKAALGELSVAACLALFLASPLLGQLLGVALSGGWMPPPPLSAAFSSPVFDDALQLSLTQRPGLQGWLPLILVPGLVLAVRQRGRAWLWAGCGLLCVVFALGPAQDLLGWRWLLPSWPVWRWIPGVDRMHHPDRWLGVGGLFFVLTAVEGLAAWRPRLVWLLPVGVLAQAGARGPLPLGTWSPDVPPHWQAVAQVPVEGEGAVIVLPLLRSPNTAAWQHAHGRPLLGGMVENQPWFLPPDFRATLDGSPLLHDLWGLTHGRHPERPVLQADLDQLRAAGFDLIVLDRRSWTRHPPSGALDPEPVLDRWLGPAVWSGPTGAAWRLPESGAPGAVPDDGPLELNGPPGPP